MSEQETNTTTEEASAENSEQQQLEQQVQAWFQLTRNILADEYKEYEVDGQVALHPTYGHLFAFRLQQEGKVYTCGFMLTELIRVFQTNGNPPLWLSSFFYDMIQEGVNRGFPDSPKSEADANRVLQEHVLPLVMKGVQEEFESNQVYVDIETNEQLGPVLELGFPSITDGPNTCAIPLQYFLTMYLLNRDPSEHAVQSLNKLLEEQNKPKTGPVQ
ncbi:MAG: hypothetical protein K0R57_823 [Paenibacillaceae bacterium]|jgi:hypothetical protein|nr:hypothetical protein [Paenibacillaceae bacterium]